MQNPDLVEQVEITPEQVIANDSTGDSSQGLSPVRLHLQSAGLEVHLQTQSTSVQVAELGGKLELALNQLKESQSRLETCFFRIGFLEAQIEQKDKELELLKLQDDRQ